MLKLLRHSTKLLTSKKPNYNLVRNFLSESFQCTKAWDNRLKAPIFQKIDYDDLYHQLDKSFQIGYKVSVLDVDLFANGINDQFVSELDDILFKLRINPETGVTFNSTDHAVIRYYLSLGKKEELLNMLADRLSYGIYPDSYLSSFMMDKFLKENDPVAAVKIATLQMLQEDFNNSIVRTLSLHSCYKYLNSTDIWSPPKPEEVDPDEEVRKVRVLYLRNPYYDEHFDIVDTNHLVGKTLLMNGIATKEPIGISSKIVGLTLFEKFQDNANLLEAVLKENISVHSEAIAKSKEYLKTKPKQSEEVKTETETDEVKANKEKLLHLLEKVEKSGNLISISLEEDSKNLVEKTVKENERKDIEEQCRIYQRWEEEREESIQNEILEEKKKKTQQEIQKTKEQLDQQEKEIFYFDNEDKWEMVIEEKEEQKKNVHYYKVKGKKKLEEEYIPPQVEKTRA